ncbi:MAG: winged helix DNA-binding protein [Candidatus Baltobacteraceae bacterium]
MSVVKNGKARSASSSAEPALERALQALAVTARLLRADAERAIARTGLSLPMASALTRLSELSEQTTVSELARSLNCNIGNLSGTLDRLEEAAYLERIVGEADRRARFLRLTAKGRRMATQLNENLRGGTVCAALKQLDAQQLEAMAEMIARLNGAVRTKTPG